MTKFWDYEKRKLATRFKLFGRHTDTVSIHTYDSWESWASMHMSTHARRNTWLGSTVPRAQSCTSPITAPTSQKHHRVHTKSESHCENPNLRALCNSAKLLLLLLFISTRWHQRGFFPFLHPPSNQHFTMNLISRSRVHSSDAQLVLRSEEVYQLMVAKAFFFLMRSL